MTRDEKLGVIAGNIRDVSSGDERLRGFLEGNLYELARIAAASDEYRNASDVARFVLPRGEAEMLARFCCLYHKICKNEGEVFPRPETAERAHAVAMPEIGRLREAFDLLLAHGLRLEAEHGDSFTSCTEDVEFGHSRYVLMPLFDPEEGRLRSFDKLRRRSGLKIHCVIYVASDDGREFAYQLCGLGFPDEKIFTPVRLLLSADTEYDPMRFLRGVEIIGAGIVSAEFEKLERSTEISRIRTVFDIESMDKRTLSALLMYLNTGADITIDGCYAEIR